MGHNIDFSIYENKNHSAFHAVLRLKVKRYDLLSTDPRQHHGAGSSHASRTTVRPPSHHATHDIAFVHTYKCTDLC